MIKVTDIREKYKYKSGSKFKYKGQELGLDKHKQTNKRKTIKAIDNKA